MLTLILAVYAKYQEFVNLIILSSFGKTLIGKLLKNMSVPVKRYLIFCIVKLAQSITLIFSENGNTGSNNNWKNSQFSSEKLTYPKVVWAHRQSGGRDIKEIIKFLTAYIRAGRSMKENTPPWRRKPIGGAHNPLKIKEKANHINLLREIWKEIEQGNKKAISVLRSKITGVNYKELYPYPKLPNVSYFEIKKHSKYHPILKLGGILKRMHMTPLLQDKSYNVFYTDTDSIVTDKPLTDSYIGKGMKYKY